MALTDAFKLSIAAQLTPVLSKTQIFKFYRSHMGKIKPFKGIIEQRLEIIELLLGITKPAEGINKSYLVDFVISSAASKTETSVTARRTSVKAVDSLSYALICSRSCNLLDSYYLKIIFSEPLISELIVLFIIIIT